MLVLEQLAYDIERLPVGHVQKLAPQSRARQQCFTLLLGQGFGITLGQEYLRRDLFRLAVPIAESLRVLFREACDVGDRFFEIAPEHERASVMMRLAEFIARRDVGDAFAQVQILEPWRLADVEMIDRMQVVIEAGQGYFARAQAAAVSQAAIHQENAQTGTGEIGAEDQAMVSGTDNDAVIGLIERLGQRSKFLEL